MLVIGFVNKTSHGALTCGFRFSVITPVLAHDSSSALVSTTIPGIVQRVGWDR